MSVNDDPNYWLIRIGGLIIALVVVGIAVYFYLEHHGIHLFVEIDTSEF
ncbi:MAG: hypothetical protein WCT04_16850 [Planctomycetota bacterium]